MEVDLLAAPWAHLRVDLSEDQRAAHPRGPAVDLLAAPTDLWVDHREVLRGALWADRWAVSSE